MENQMTKTIFINAEKGGISIDLGPGNRLGSAKTPKTLNKLINDNDLQGEVAFCSSMDFADEYGFKNGDGARILWNKTMEMRG